MTPGIFGSFTNSTVADKKRTTINYGYKYQDDHHARRIILQSKVDWKDTKNALSDGEFRVILTAEANESNNLDNRSIKGSVYIYPRNSEPSKVDDKIDLPWFNLIHPADKTLTAYREQEQSTKTAESWQKVQEQLNKAFESLEQAFINEHPIKEHYYKINFTVNSRGITSLLSDNCQDKTTEYIILRQAFYYIKYSLHSHKHHHAEEDSLTTIIQKNTSDTEKDEVGLRLIGQLKRELTSIKRTYSSGGSKVFCDEQGIIAYMNSFYTSLHKDQYLSDELYKREIIYLESMKSSFNVQTNKQNQKDHKTVEIKNTYRTVLALTLSGISILWLTVLQHFTLFSENTVNSTPLEFIESIIVFITIFVCLIFTYVTQVNRTIENTLDTEGLRTWVEQYYVTQDDDFKKQYRYKKLQAISIALITALIFFGGPLLVKALII